MTDTAVIRLAAEIITHSGATECTPGMKIGRNKKSQFMSSKIRFREMAAILFDSVFLQKVLIYGEIKLKSYKAIHIANRPDFATELTFLPPHSSLEDEPL